MDSVNGALVLGLDVSTQSVTAVVAECDGVRRICSEVVNFDKDLPHFGTKNGMIHGKGGEVKSPVAMWLAGIDGVMAALQARPDLDLSRIAAISGSAQQHGSVYWAEEAAGSDGVLKLDPSETLETTLKDAFSVAMSPIWADSSTSAQCESLEAKLGGPKAVTQLTGSRAYARFTGNQIAKVAETNPSAWAKTHRVGLVSSMLSSVLAGKHIACEFSDASGMNLMDIRSHRWSPKAMAANGAADLAAKLGPEPISSQDVVGTVAPYFAERYGIPAEAVVVACTGDNPSSVAGLGLGMGDMAISLGTSDTLMVVTSTPTPTLQGHVMVHPAVDSAYFAMLCYANGSPGRESVRNRCAAADWTHFVAALSRTPPGNNGQVGFFFDNAEIVPVCPPGIRRYDSDSNWVEGSFDDDAEIRAVVECKFMSMRLHKRSLGHVGTPPRIIATGGASVNKGLMQVLANVMGCPVLVAESSDSAALGACCRAAHSFAKISAKNVSYHDVVGKALATGLVEAAKPDMDAHKTYTELLERFGECEAKAVASLTGDKEAEGKGAGNVPLKKEIKKAKARKSGK